MMFTVMVPMQFPVFIICPTFLKVCMLNFESLCIRENSFSFPYAEFPSSKAEETGSLKKEINRFFIDESYLIFLDVHLCNMN